MQMILYYGEVLKVPVEWEKLGCDCEICANFVNMSCRILLILIQFICLEKWEVI